MPIKTTTNKIQTKIHIFLTSMGTLAFSQALDLNNIDDSSYHKYCTLAGIFLYYYYWRLMCVDFYMRYMLIDIPCTTICYLSSQESIVEPHLLQDLPIYLHTLNAMICHSHSMSSIIRLFQSDL